MMAVEMASCCVAENCPDCGGRPKACYLRDETALPLRGEAMRLPQRVPGGAGGRKEPLRGRIHQAEACGGRRDLPDGNDRAAQGLPSVCRLQTMGLTPKEARTPEWPTGPWHAAGRASQVNSLPPSPFSPEAQRAPGGGQTTSALPLTRPVTLLFSRSVVSNSLLSLGLCHARFPCPSPPLGACSDSCPLSR